MNWRHLPPVDVPAPRPGRMSQTLLSRADRCPRSAYLYLLHEGGAGSHEMDRGTLTHIFAERLMWTLIEHGEENLYAGAEQELAAEFEASQGRQPTVPEVDVMRAEARSKVADHSAAIVDEILRDRPDLVVPAREVDRVREMAYHLAVGLDVRPGEVVAVEQKFVLDVAGWEVSAKIDLLSLSGDVLQVDDYKTSFAVPSQEEFDGRFQLPLYAAAVAFGVPVEKVECVACDGTGSPFAPDRHGHLADLACEICGGRARVEVRREPVGDRVQWFRVRELYPRYLGDDGLVRSRWRTISRTDLHDFVADLERLVQSTEARLGSGDWPAVPGSHCSECPAAAECPLPGHLRDHAGTIETHDQAAEALAKIETERLQHNATLAEVRNWAKRGGPVRVGRDLVYDWREESKRETDYDGLDAGVAAAVEYGEPFELARYRRTRHSTAFKKRKVTPAELAEERARGQQQEEVA